MGLVRLSCLHSRFFFFELAPEPRPHIPYRRKTCDTCESPLFLRALASKSLFAGSPLVLSGAQAIRPSVVRVRLPFPSLLRGESRMSARAPLLHAASFPATGNESTRRSFRGSLRASSGGRRDRSHIPSNPVDHHHASWESGRFATIFLLSLLEWRVHPQRRMIFRHASQENPT